MKRDSWNTYFMKIAFLASKRSTCLRRQVGAVLVKDKNIIATGYNGPPSKIKHCEKCLREELNLASGTNLDICRAIHAEQNCIIQSAKHGISTDGSTLYVTNMPCFTCAKMLINAGVETILFSLDYPDDNTKLLLKEADVALLTMLV